MRIAVLGLGRMGQALAGRVLEAGHQTTVWNRTAGQADELVGRGAKESRSVGEAVAGADVVLVSLSGDDAVRQVLLPNGKPVAGLDGVVVDCSTVAPTTSREESAGYPGRFVACPIAGAPQAVAAGKSLLIVAGSPEAVEVAGPALAALSDSRHDAGDYPQTAAIIKLMNNYLLLGGLALLADAVAFGQANGLDDAALDELLNDLPVVAGGLKNRIGGLLGSEHEAWFSVDLGSKDLRLFAEVAAQSPGSVGLADAVQSRYVKAADLGLGSADLSAVIEPLRRPA